ncbi:MAG: hypothetical protein QOD39_982 [Mycobacterium sp.]|nr:hypothetical protein [Mycobacterium sp.]
MGDDRNGSGLSRHLLTSAAFLVAANLKAALKAQEICASPQVPVHLYLAVASL